MSIVASQKQLQELFNLRNYQFRIPGYQRPYAWREEEAQALIDDLINAYRESQSGREYFLGSIVVIQRPNDQISEVVDGQQRLTSLTILLSVIRNLLPSTSLELKQNISGMLESRHLGDDSIGLTIRKADNGFFKKYVVGESEMQTLLTMDAGVKRGSSQECIRDNAKTFHKQLLEFAPADHNQEEALLAFLKYVLDKTYVVIVATEDFDNAYKIFSSLNNRGLDLDTPDILKAILLEKVSEESKLNEYTEKWESKELDLGRDAFRSLFTHIHRIRTHRRAGSSLLKEYENDILVNYSTLQFIDDVLVPLSDSYRTVLTANFECDDMAQKRRINLLLRWLNRAENTDWCAPAIAFLSHPAYSASANLVEQFLKKLERLVACSMVLRDNVNVRAARYKPVFEAIEESAEIAISSLHNSLNDQDKEGVLRALHGNVYGERYLQYVLLRIDSDLAVGNISPSLDWERISIEHVLPQTLTPYWSDDWGKDDLHEQWVNKLGNLVLLSQRKNSEAQNYEFERKKKVYFSGRMTEDGSIIACPITIQVLETPNKYDDRGNHAGPGWNFETVKRRQDDYLARLIGIWEIS
ncbi:DUF262 domain-containing protein [Synechococcus sp. CS-1332]|uniref:DUF262 domain-containing protein n=1 Tax=Synechococcus sp. CS-1332 TaxID=2847972 RepID=UPI00223BAB05|nr:DUF262 domain-containing HNH endonuclease family protein [Synechococcus sp. CS-1332]MCT0206443.1 DUF262 domain-containing HNH endonuclease family protein [Synechococcus sp. CS-1332]